MRVPEQILSRLDQDMRAAMGSKLTADSGFISQLKLEDKNLKERARDVLWSLYESVGFHAFMQVVGNMKTYKGRELSELVQVKGEVAEVVLEIIVDQFIKEMQIKNWHVMKGLIIGSKSNANFSTEIDLTIITPAVVSIVEIKSYNGDKVITDDCFLRAKNKSQKMEKDIFAQNKLHINAFWDMFGKYAKGKAGVVKSVLFSFANGSLKDERTKEKIAVMPVYDEMTFPRYLKALQALDRAPMWEVDRLVKAIKASQKSSRSSDEHIRYVKSIHGDV